MAPVAPMSLPVGCQVNADLAQAYVDLLTAHKCFKPCVSFGQDNGLVYATVPATSTQVALAADCVGFVLRLFLCGALCDGGVWCVADGKPFWLGRDQGGRQGQTGGRGHAAGAPVLPTLPRPRQSDLHHRRLGQNAVQRVSTGWFRALHAIVTLATPSVMILKLDI